MRNSVAFPGLSINGFINSPSAGIAFLGLTAFRGAAQPGPERRGHRRKLQAKFNGVQGAFVAVFPPPPVQGLGTIGGFKLQVEDRARPRLRHAGQRHEAGAGEGCHDARTRRGFQLLPDQHAPALRRSGPHQGAAARRHRAGRVRHDADLPGIILHQRLQQVRAHLPGHRAGGQSFSLQAGRHPQAEDPQRGGRDGSAGRDDPAERLHRTRKRDALQRLPFRRPERRSRARLFERPVADGDHPHPQGNPAQRHELGVDRTDLPARNRRQHGAGRFPHLRAAGVSRAGSQIRKLCSCRWR